MGTAIGVVLVFFVALVIVGAAVNSIKKSGQKMRHRNKCAACHARLKVDRGNYATTCAKCGTVQPWAKTG